jgi:hypothetical protein
MFFEGLVVGVVLSALVAYWLIERIFQQVIEQIVAEQRTEIQTINATIDKVDGILYCYDENKQFLCQGTTLAEIEQAYRDRYQAAPSTVLRLTGDEEIIRELISCE